MNTQSILKVNKNLTILCCIFKLISRFIFYYYYHFGTFNAILLYSLSHLLVILAIAILHACLQGAKL